jgi:hypothetical protein
MAKQTPDHWAPGHSLRWRLAGLTLAVLALHALALAWWLGEPERPPIVAGVTTPQTLAAHTAPATLGRVAVSAQVAEPAPASDAPRPAPAQRPPEFRTGAGKNTPKPPPSPINQDTIAPVSNGSDPVPSFPGWNTLAGAEPPSTATPVVNPLAEPLEEATASHTLALLEPPPNSGDWDGAPTHPADAEPLLVAANTGTVARPRPAGATEQATVPRRLAVPASRTLEFRVRASRKGLTLPADSTLTWENRGNGYSASMLFKAMLGRSRSQTSVGAIDPVLGLQPRRFGDKNRSEVATHFDRSRQPPAIRFSHNAPDQPLLPHTQDRLSVLIQLAAMVAGEPQRYPPGQAVVLHTVSSRDADLWRFAVKKNEVLDLPVGAMDTVHLVREALNAYDNRVEVWLAPRLGHLPVRILWTQANGDVVDQQLSAHRP